MLSLGYSFVAVLFLSGAPIFVAFGLGSVLIILFHYDMPAMELATILFTKIDNYILVAVPLFILTGKWLLHGGAIKRAVNFFDSWIGHFRGGLFGVTVIFCMIFGAITGETVAAIVSIGTIIYPEMRRHGYPASLSGGMVTVASMLGSIIPPSVIMLVMASIMEISTASLFATGMFPGIMVAFLLSTVGVIIAKKRNFPVKPRDTWRNRWITLFKAIPFLLIPITVLGGIYSGFVTPTEAATLGCLLALINGLFIYRELTWQQIWKQAIETVQVTASVYILMAGIGAFSFVLNRSGLAVNLAQWVLNQGVSPLTFVLFWVILLFFLGFLLPDMATMLMLLPVALPIVKALNVNPYWFASVSCLNVIAGGATPPFAFSIWVASSTLGLPMDKIIKGILPFLPFVFLVLLLCIFFPEIMLFLPRWMGLPV